MPVFWTRNKSEVDQAKHRVRYPQLKTWALHWTQYLNFNDHDISDQQGEAPIY